MDHTSIRPALHEAQVRGARAAAAGLAKAHPVIDDALRQAAPAADAAIKRVTPVIEGTLTRIPSAIDAARDKLGEDLVPKLAIALATLAEQPVSESLAATIYSTELVASGRKMKKVKKKGSLGKKFGVLALLAAAGGIVYVAVKKVLAPPDAGWITHTPSDAYIADPTSDDDEAKVVSIVNAPVDQTTVGVSPEEEDYEVPGESPYGPDSYVGDEPPAGYEVKGNARSMKYHVPGQVMYDRTAADVWFVSAEAAERVGFTPVSR